MTLKDLTAAISSPGSPDGISPCSSPDGETCPSGQAAVHVSRFRARDSERAMPTNDTSGPLFTTLSPSAGLHCLANRLRARMAGNGSPLYALTWSDWDMPAGPPICRLRASGLLTSSAASIRLQKVAILVRRPSARSARPCLRQRSNVSMEMPAAGAARLKLRPCGPRAAHTGFELALGRHARSELVDGAGDLLRAEHVNDLASSSIGRGVRPVGRHAGSALHRSRAAVVGEHDRAAAIGVGAENCCRSAGADCPATRDPAGRRRRWRR